jgi:hypothetical protein
LIHLIIFFLSGFGFVAGSEAIGHLILNRLGWGWERMPLVISIGLGLTVLTLLLMVLGGCGMFTAPIMQGVMGALILMGMFRVATRFGRNQTRIETLGTELELLPTVLRISLAVMLIACFASVMTPETRHDPYDYHLTVPTLYLAEGKITEIPWHVFSYMPKNGEILYGLALGIGNDSITKLFHFLFGCFCILTVSSFMERTVGKIGGMLSAVLIATLPLFGFLATSSYIDLARAYWELLALYCLSCFWTDETNEKKQATTWLALSALFAGMALGTKYVAWVVFLPPIALLFFVSHYHQDRKLRRRLLPLLFVILICPFICWLVCNTVWTGNPVYPLFPTLFSMHAPAADQAYEFFRGHAPPADVYSFPRIFSYVLMRFHRLMLDGNALIPVGLMGIAIILWQQKHERNPLLQPVLFKGMGMYLALSGALFLLGCNNDDGRFCFSTIAMLSIPATLFLLFVNEIARKQSRLGFLILPFIVLIFLLNGILFRKAQIQDLREAIVPIVTELQRGEWLSRRFPNYPAIEWANENLPHDAMVLGMGYPLRRRHISSVKFGYIPFLEGVDSNITSSPLAKILRENGVTHIVKPFPMFPYEIDFSILLPDQLTLIHHYRGISIYALNPEKDG